MWAPLRRFERDVGSIGLREAPAEADAQTKEMLALTNEYLAANGNTMTLKMGWKDPEKARFQANKSSAQYAGEVSGSLLTFKYYTQEGTLRLVDESAIEGTVTDQYKKKRIRMIGRMEFR